MDIEGLENREVSLDVWLKIRILEKEALHEKDPNPKGCAGLNANAGLETWSFTLCSYRGRVHSIWNENETEMKARLWKFDNSLIK